jgi:hypothetical protein
LLPTLHAVSAFGTRLAFYSKAKDHQIVPGGIPPNPVLLTDTAPSDWWSCDVLEEKGRQRFRSLVTEIVQACENLECKYSIDKQATLVDASQNRRMFGHAGCPKCVHYSFD